MCIPPNICRFGYRPTATPVPFVLYYMTVIALGLMLHSMEYQLKLILIWRWESRCHSDIRHFESQLLPVWSTLSINSVNWDKTEMSNMNFLSTLIILISQLPCLFSMAKAVSPTVEVVNMLTSNPVNSLNLAMSAFTSKCFPFDVVPYSDGWQRIWWQMIHMIPGLLVCNIPRYNFNGHEATSLELY